MDERFRLILIGAIVGAFSAFASLLLMRMLTSGASLLAPMRAHTTSFLLPAAGAALSVLALRYLFRETGGHGVPEVIYSISRRGGLLRLRSTFSRLISSFLTIASGGSAGPEAPVVISGSSIGSNVSNIFNANERQRVVIVGCGAAGAIASIFNAPMAGIAFSLEAILGEWTPVNLVPIAVASVVATEVSRILGGNQIPFEHRIFHAGLLDLGASLGLAFICAAGSVLLVRMLKVTERASSHLIRSPLVRAASGGLLVGAIALALPSISGEGYETVTQAIEGTFRQGVWIVAIAAVAKIAATSLTIGSGGSGGVFAPCLVIGSLAGVFFQRGLGSLAPTLPLTGEGFFALLGMAGLISGVLQAPLTGIFLIIEITASYEVVAPVVLVAVVSATLSHRFEPYSVYHQELMARGELLRPRTDARVLADLRIREILDSRCMTLKPGMKLKDLVAIIPKTRQSCFPVLDRENGRYLGIIDINEIRPFLFDTNLHETVLVEEIMDDRRNWVSPHEELSGIMEEFESRHVSCLPVVEGNRFIGLISKTTLLEHYRKELIVQEDQ